MFLMRKKIDLRKIKKRKCYTVKELANTLDVTIQSIYWRIHHKGLPSLNIDNVKYITGKEFCKTEMDIRKNRKIKFKKNSFLCFCCHRAVLPLNNEVKIEDFKDSEKTVPVSVIQLIGVCESCGNKIYKCTNMSMLDKIKTQYKLL